MTDQPTPPPGAPPPPSAPPPPGAGWQPVVPLEGGSKDSRAAMRHLAWSGLKGHPGRFVATTMAVVIATLFLAGALVLRDTLDAAIEANAESLLAKVDLAVEPPANALSADAGFQLESPSKVPPGTAAKVAGVEGVAAAAGVEEGPIDLLDADGVIAASLTGRNWIGDESLEPFTLVEGSAPQRPGEVVVDADTAEAHGLRPGSSVALATTGGKQSGTVVGIVRFGSRASPDPGGTVLVPTTVAAPWLAKGQPGFDAVWVAVDPGLDPSSVQPRVQAAVGADLQVVTGQSLRDLEKQSREAITGPISTALQAFAYLALLVACFIIYNTFSVVVGQRTREFALLRSLGASRKQVGRSVRVESVLVGLAASAVGILLGSLGVLVLTRFVPAFGQLVGGGAPALRVGPWSVAQVLVSGTIVTVLSAVVPSWRAGRVAPLEAEREALVDTAGTSRLRGGIGLGLLAVGIVLVLVGLTLGNGWVGVLGVPPMFLGVLVAGPVLAAAFARLCGLLIVPVARLSGRLAVDGVARNPRRAATTANALVIGVFLVVFVTAAGGALRDESVRLVSQFGGADLTVVSQQGGLPAGIEGQIAKVDGVRDTAEVYGLVGLAGGLNLPVGAFDPAKASVVGLDDPSGTLSSLAPDQLAVADFFVQAGQIKEGQRVEVRFPNGNMKVFTVGPTTSFSTLVPPLAMSIEAARAADESLQPDTLAISVASGRSAEVETGVKQVTSGYSDVEVLPGNAIAQFVEQLFDAVIASVNGLLGVAVLIAVFGIVNTLLLSVHERTHEIGLLRAVGMSRRQVRRTVRIEAVLVALLGVLVGTAFGLFLAWAGTRDLFEGGFGTDSGGFSLPGRELALILLGAVVVGVVASLLPAWRAGRMNVLEAIRTE